jgi:CBS domain containing-hemolysin-like protein
MSSEQDYTEEAVPEVIEKKAPVCAITSEGITLMGFHLSWMVLLLVAVVLYFVFNGDRLSSLLGDSSSSPSSSSVTSRAMGPRASMGPRSATVGISANVSGPRMTTPPGPSGDIARMFGHNDW